MGNLKELSEMPDVIVNACDYVPKKEFCKYLVGLLEAEKEDSNNSDEKYGIDIAIQRIEILAEIESGE